MSDLKINYQKSEVIGIGILEVECVEVADLQKRMYAYEVFGYPCE
jgi:hypothetical protein